MGHAGYAKKFLFHTEPDILCAAISAIVTGTVNALTELAGEEIQVVTNEETGFLKADIINPEALQEKSVFLLDAMVLNLAQISKEYGETYLQVSIQEV